MRNLNRTAHHAYRRLLHQLEALETRQLLSVSPGIMTLDGTTLTSNQTLPWQAGIALNVRAVDGVDANNNPTGPTSFTSGSNPNSTLFSWNFGDSAANIDTDYTSGVRTSHTLEVGYNAAHIYDTPGTYPLTLTTTDQNGVTNSFTVNVQITNSTLGPTQSNVSLAGANIIYVDSTNGSDSYTGTSPIFTSGSSGPFKSFAAVVKQLHTAGWTNNVQVRFMRGETFNVYQSDYNNNGGVLTDSNILFGAYGNTNLAKPILSSADTSLAAIFFDGAYNGFDQGTYNWTIQDLQIGSAGLSNTTAYSDGIRMRGTDMAVRNVTFGNNVSNIFTWGEVHGVLVQDSTDNGNWNDNYCIACVQVSTDWVVVGNSFTGASYNPGSTSGHQPFIRWESVNTAFNGRIMFEGNIDEPSAFNSAALTFREDSGTIGGIGSPSPSPTNSYSSAGVYTFTSGGTGFGGASDQFGTLTDAQAGNSTMIAQITSLTNTAAGTEAGVTVRAAGNANDPHASVMVTPNSTINFQYRTTSGGATTTTSASTTAQWVKIVSTGNSYAGYYSSDDISWTQIGTAVTISMGTTPNVGFAMASGLSGTAATATVANATLNGYLFGGHANAYIYAANNTIANGLMNFGFKGSNTSRYLEDYTVADSNTLINSQLSFGNSGIHVMARNNIMQNYAGDTTDPDAIDEQANTTVAATGWGEEDLEILNNTVYTTQTGIDAGRFDRYSGPCWHDTIIANNLLVPVNATSSSYSADLWVSSTAEYARISNNLWYNPTTSTFNLVNLNNSGSNITVAAWNTTRATIGGSAFSSSLYNDQDDQGNTIILNAAGVPSLASAAYVDIAQPIAGVWADFNGKPRTASTWTVGAYDIISVAAPSNLVATNVSSTQINLTWADNSNNETGFTLQRSTSVTFSSPTNINLGANVTNYSDTGLTAGTPYYYRIAATGSAGNSAYSPTANATPSASGIFTIDQDIGSPLPAGSASFSAGTYTMTSSGSDITGTADQFNLLSENYTGDGALIAQVNSISNTNVWAKGGVMFRDSAATNAMFAMMVATPGQGVVFEYRTSTGANSALSQITGITAPVWVKVIRTGNNFSGYYSTNGNTWSQVGTTQAIAMNPIATAGLALTSHATGTLCTATFSNVAFTGIFAGDLDIGSPAPAGAASYAAGVYTITASGSNIWGTSDQFNYLLQNVSGNQTLTAQVTGLTNTSSSAKAGLMFRGTNSPSSAFAQIDIQPSGLLEFLTRSADNASATNSIIGTVSPGAPTPANPIWERLVRNGNTFSAYYATGTTTPTTWTLIGSVNLANITTTNYLAGLTACSHSTGNLTTATFANVTFDTLFADQDIGAPALAGSSSFNAATNTYTVAGSGADIWNTSDQFNFLNTSSTGDAGIQAQVTSISNTNAYAEAGVMFRNDTTAGSAFAAVSLTPTAGVTFRWRTTAGNSVSQTIVAGLTAPVWVKLLRVGTTFSAYYSSNGTTWTQVGSNQTITMNATIQTGLDICSHNTSQINTATFTNVSLFHTPAAPTSFTYNNPTPTGVTLNWLDSNTNETGLTLLRSTDPNFATYTTIPLAAGTTTYTDSGLTANTIYYYRLVAVNQIGNSLYTDLSYVPA